MGTKITLLCTQMTMKEGLKIWHKSSNTARTTKYACNLLHYFKHTHNYDLKENIHWSKYRSQILKVRSFINGPLKIFNTKNDSTSDQSFLHCRSLPQRKSKTPVLVT